LKQQDRKYLEAEGKVLLWFMVRCSAGELENIKQYTTHEVKAC